MREAPERAIALEGGVCVEVFLIGCLLQGPLSVELEFSGQCKDCGHHISLAADSVGYDRLDERVSLGLCFLNFRKSSDHERP